MKKQTLERFIKKYSLNNTIESVKWNVDTKNQQLKTSAITEEKNVLVSVVLSKFDGIAEDCELGVNDTSKLNKMMGVLGDEFTAKLNKKDDKITSISLEDGDTEMQFVTADLSVIPNAPNLKKIPDFNAEIVLDEELINKFIKAKGALADTDIFTLLMNKKQKMELVLGHSTLNSNKIKLGVKTQNNKDSITRNINFSARYLKEILTANGDCDNAVLKVSDAGLATITFVKDEFESTYYMVEIKTAE